MSATKFTANIYSNWLKEQLCNLPCTHRIVYFLCNKYLKQKKKTSLHNSAKPFCVSVRSLVGLVSEGAHWPTTVSRHILTYRPDTDLMYYTHLSVKWQHPKILPQFLRGSKIDEQCRRLWQRYQAGVAPNDRLKNVHFVNKLTVKL